MVSSFVIDAMIGAESCPRAELESDSDGVKEGKCSPLRDVSRLLELVVPSTTLVAGTARDQITYVARSLLPLCQVTTVQDGFTNTKIQTDLSFFQTCSDRYPHKLTLPALPPLGGFVYRPPPLACGAKWTGPSDVFWPIP